jgi:hypothetical protein
MYSLFGHNTGILEVNNAKDCNGMASDDTSFLLSCLKIVQFAEMWSHVSCPILPIFPKLVENIT